MPEKETALDLSQQAYAQCLREQGLRATSRLWMKEGNEEQAATEFAEAGRHCDRKIALRERLEAIPADAPEQLKAKDAEIAELNLLLTNEKAAAKALSKSMSMAHEAQDTAEARVKELEEQKKTVRDLVRFVLERRELEPCWFVDADGDTADCAAGDHCNAHCPLYKLVELVR